MFCVKIFPQQSPPRRGWNTVSYDCAPCYVARGISVKEEAVELAQKLAENLFLQAAMIPVAPRCTTVVDLTEPGTGSIIFPDSARLPTWERAQLMRQDPPPNQRWEVDYIVVTHEPSHE